MSYPGLTSDFNLGANLPPDIAIEAQRLNRRQKIADLLMAQSTHPLQAAPSKGRFQAPISWVQGLGQLGQAGAGAFISYKNDTGAQELAKAIQDRRAKGRVAFDKSQEGTPEIPGTPDRTDIVSNRFNVGGVEDPSGAVMDPDTMEGWNASRQHVTKAVQDALDQTSKKVLYLQERQRMGVPLDPEQQTFLEMNQTQSELPVNPIESISRDNEHTLPMLASLGERHGTEGMGGGVEAGIRYSLPVAPIQSEMAVPGTPGTPAVPASREQMMKGIQDALMSDDPVLQHMAEFKAKQLQHQEDQALKEREHAARLEETKLLREQNFTIQMEGLEERKATRVQRGDEIAARLVDTRTTNEEKAELRKEQIRLADENKKAELKQEKLIADMRDANEKANIALRRDMNAEKTAERKEKAAKEGKLTESQANANIYATRGREAHDILNEADKDGVPLEERISVPGLAAKQGAEGVPFVGGALGAIGNTMLSPDQQRVEQAQRNFINAALRKESGASISKPEFDNARKQYFPQPGDSADVIKQKRQNRETEIRGLETAAGPAHKPKASAAPGVGPFNDAEKEKRYQEWKKKNQ